MPIAATSYCPYCKRRIIVEKKESGVFPLGMIELHKVNDYEKRYKTKQ